MRVTPLQARLLEEWDVDSVPALIEKALALSDWKISKAAELLGVHRHGLRKWMRKYRLRITKRLEEED